MLRLVAFPYVMYFRLVDDVMFAHICINCMAKKEVINGAAIRVSTR